MDDSALWRYHQQMIGPWVILSPFTAALIMAWIIEGKAGVVQLLRRCLLWRVNITWYIIALFCMPAAYILGISLKQGAIASFQPSASFLFLYLINISFLFLGAIGEEPGWRGFALPRLQERYGPLSGTLILGSLWAFWHLPVWLFVPGGNAGGEPSGLLPISISFVGWVSFILAVSIIMTWIFNHTRGSVLLMMLFHAAINASYVIIPRAFFPLLFPLESKYAIPVFTEIILVLVAVLIIMATRSRLGYDHHLRDTALLTSSSAHKI
jgi:uncharacterized protein